MFNDDLKACILKWAKMKPTNNSCELVLLNVMEELGFDIKPLLKYTWPFRSGIQQKINALTDLAKSNSFMVKELNFKDAQDVANYSKGNEIVLALMNDTITADRIKKSHVAFIIQGEYSDAYGAACGGGGMVQAYIDKGWVLSNARIHFTEFNKVKYFVYCYKKGA
jgi:hypothetical protein